MAFEIWTADERERARVTVTRKREAWKRDTELERHFYDTAKLVCETREEQEEAVLAAAAAPAGDAGRLDRLRNARRAWTRSDEFFKILEVKARYGFKAAERMFEGGADVHGFTEEEGKRLGKVLKQLEDETKEKTGRKRKEQDNDEETEHRMVISGGGSGFGGGGSLSGSNMGHYNSPGGGNFNQFSGTYNPGWGYDPAQVALAFGYQQGGGWPTAGANWSGNGSGWMGPGTGQGVGTGGGGVVAKKKGACNNCGGLDHFSYNPICPNFAIHMQQLKAKAETYRKMESGGGESTDRTLALRGPSGIKYKMLIVDESICNDCRMKEYKVV